MQIAIWISLVQASWEHKILTFVYVSSHIYLYWFCYSFDISQ